MNWSARTAALQDVITLPKFVLPQPQKFTIENLNSTATVSELRRERTTLYLTLLRVAAAPA